MEHSMLPGGKSSGIRQHDDSEADAPLHLCLERSDSMDIPMPEEDKMTKQAIIEDNTEKVERILASANPDIVNFIFTDRYDVRVYVCWVCVVYVCLVVYVCFVFCVVCSKERDGGRVREGERTKRKHKIYVVVMNFNVVCTIDDTSI